VHAGMPEAFSSWRAALAVGATPMTGMPAASKQWRATSRAVDLPVPAVIHLRYEVVR